MKTVPSEDDVERCVSENFQKSVSILPRFLHRRAAGNMEPLKVIHGTKYILNEEHGKLLDRFLEWKQYGSNTRDDAIWAVRKYLFHFQQQGHESISDVTVEDARQFLWHENHAKPPGAFHDLINFLGDRKKQRTRIFRLLLVRHRRWWHESHCSLTHSHNSIFLNMIVACIIYL